MSAPSTTEILALRALERSPDQDWINWAIQLLIEGYDSPTLRVMSGESSPFHIFELWAMTDRVIGELGFTPFNDKLPAAIAIATVRANQMLTGVISQQDGLSDISILHDELDMPAELTDFFLLHHAVTDLSDYEVQYYWPGGDRGNIKNIIDTHCRSWIGAQSSE